MAVYFRFVLMEYKYTKNKKTNCYLLYSVPSVNNKSQLTSHENDSARLSFQNYHPLTTRLKETRTWNVWQANNIND